MSVGKKSSESKSMLRVKSVCTKGKLSSRMGLTADNEGNVLVCSYDNKEGIKKISQTDGTISTIEAAVIKPHDVVIDPKGNLFVVGYDPPMFVKVSPQGKVETMIQQSYQADTFTCLVLGIDGNYYITDYRKNAVYKVTPNGIFSTLVLDNNLLHGVYGLASLPNGELVAVSFYNHTILRISLDGTVSLFAGISGFPGNENGDIHSALFHNPLCITTDRRGNIFLTESGNSQLRKITPEGIVSTVDLGHKLNYPTFLHESCGSIYLAVDSGIIRISFLTEWTPTLHCQFPLNVQKQVFSLMLLGLKNPNTGYARHPQCLCYKLPKDILLIICSFVGSMY